MGRLICKVLFFDLRVGSIFKKICIEILAALCQFHAPERVIVSLHSSHSVNR